MKTVSITQMRMGSGRLPGKALVKIGDQTVLEIMVRRLRTVKRIDDVVIATSMKSENDCIEEFCHKMGVTCFRGSEDDVLGRTAGAAKASQADRVVQVYGDGPFICPDVVNFILDAWDGSHHWIGNSMKTTFPPGQEVEVIDARALDKAERESHGLAVREHATLFLRQNPQHFRIKNIEAPPQWYRPEISLELDEPKDLELFTRLVSVKNPIPLELQTLISILDENPDITEINSHIERRWKQFRN